MMPTAIPKIQTIRLYCDCKLPDFVDNMIKCDNYACRKGNLTQLI